MDRTVTLDEAHYRRAVEKARSLGKTPEQYVQELIDADGRTFDDILAPVREGFASMSDDELDDLFERARQATRESK